ncbi:hypothetical protein FDN13_05930 [Caloramator sp. E03]|uniref:hypothetical protein n=1 Tax=Caloramator sp. E03 TaxID=2576307 RepID=UPI0011105CEC|nr:hypothetical protein [Caloramator sp. E03]QCX33278.1 hypothetical protein FDN13_05930 [Caloramator sp. E03]
MCKISNRPPILDIVKNSNADLKILDTYIFPILFLYRHSIEISLKSIYLRFYGQLPEKIKSKSGHELNSLWEKVKEILNITKSEDFIKQIQGYKTKIIKFSTEDIDINEIDEFINEIDSIDANGDVFRYLMNNKGKLYFSKNNYVDYDNLQSTFNKFYDIFDYFYDMISEYL